MACCKCAILNEALAWLLSVRWKGALVGAQALSKAAWVGNPRSGYEWLCNLLSLLSSLDFVSLIVICSF